MRGWLNANMPRLDCRQFNFTPNGGNILKLAIARQSTPFIDDILIFWKVDLNQVDAVDGETVLDYIGRLREQAGANEKLVQMYSRYYDRFRKAGARKASELRT
jgi:hypothetical protein